MSEKQEKRKRFNAKLRYIHDFESWMNREPNKLRIFAHRKWKKEMPKFNDYLKG